MEHVMSQMEDNPIIAGIKDELSLKTALDSECKIVFVLNSTIMNVASIVSRIKKHNKLAFIHVDLLEGASSKEVVLEFLRKNTAADGIISTKAPLVKQARNYGFITIHRFFLTDSMSYHSIDRQISNSDPDIIETCPGGMTKTIGWVKNKVSLPIIASGLVCDKEDVVNALKNGAIAISSTNTEVWAL
ncbi:glycerol-3-phosphate responsive antiterminator [Salibacterium aidingense]|uniref:glycerol-3-phosphate responsive antiterminator n=1 Tax=Salibacterium aidingense TaxID=384933 RepID=UPI00047C6313|nr:glycerol-3-phosphate responsive antiterminator [Salibacterium aidingense]